jgi:hypothetical protein
MNDPTRRGLMIVVERAVRPVRATVKRKRRMREELLGHLTAVFEEETQRLSDVEAALEHARRRFGDPAELTRELQRTVPGWDRFGYYVEKQRYEPGESPWHLAGKYLVMTLVMCAVMVLPAAITLWRRGRSWEIEMALQVVFGLGLNAGTLGFAAAYLPIRIGRALYGDDRERSPWAVAKYGLASAVAFVISFFLFFLALPGDFNVVSRHFALLCCFAPAVPVLFCAMARKMADENRHEEEWASLDIDG